MSFSRLLLLRDPSFDFVRKLEGLFFATDDNQRLALNKSRSSSNTLRDSHLNSVSLGIHALKELPLCVFSSSGRMLIPFDSANFATSYDSCELLIVIGTTSRTVLTLILYDSSVV
jgi:hypothetical protein